MFSYEYYTIFACEKRKKGSCLVEGRFILMDIRSFVVDIIDLSSYGVIYCVNFRILPLVFTNFRNFRFVSEIEKKIMEQIEVVF